MMVEVLRGGGLPKAEVLALEARPLLLSQGQVSVTTEWSNDPEDLVVFAGDHGLMGKILEMTGYLPSGAPVTMCGLVQAAVKVSAGVPGGGSTTVSAAPRGAPIGRRCGRS